MMWATIPQLDGLPGLPSSRPRRRDYLEGLGVGRRQREARGGGFEYLVTDLPAPAQQAIAARVAGSIKPVTTAIEAGKQASRAAQTKACADSMARLGVQLDRAGAFDPATNPRLDLFQRFETYHRARGGAVWPCVQEFCALWDAGQIEALPSTTAGFKTLPPKTLDKWYRAWRLNGVEALLERKPRSDKGQSRLTQDENLHRVFIATLAEMHDPTARQVHRVIVNQLGAEAAPAIGTLKRWLREFKGANKATLMKLKNPDGWRNKFMPAFGSRSEHITRVNEEWQLDSTIADSQQRVEVAFNLTDGSTGEIRRHALVASIDVFTRRAQVLVSRTSSANAVKAVMRRAILAYGLPERVKTDNGKDYTAREFDFALDALRVQHILCNPFSPEQKPFIERFLGTMLRDLFPMLEGFVGHSVAQRKEIESGKSFAQRFGDKGVDLRMTPQDLQRHIDAWLVEYHARPHSELGCSPDEMAQRHQTHVVRVDERALDLFLMPVAGTGLRIVTKRGIALDNAYFAAPELGRLVGDQVYCRQDDADLGALHVFALDGAYICRAVDHSLLGINRAELAARTRVVREAAEKPLLDQLRQARREGVVRKAVDSIHRDREATAVASAGNVARLAPRVVVETSPAVASVIAHREGASTQAARADAEAAFQAPAVTVVAAEPLNTPNAMYSAWVRLQARKTRNEAVSQRELDWASRYECSSEFAAWHELHEGSDPLAQASG